MALSTMYIICTMNAIFTMCNFFTRDNARTEGKGERGTKESHAYYIMCSMLERQECGNVIRVSYNIVFII